jgi:hypothetical protein
MNTAEAPARCELAQQAFVLHERRRNAPGKLIRANRSAKPYPYRRVLS